MAKAESDGELADRFDRGADDIISGANRYSRDSEFVERRLALAQEYRARAADLRRSRDGRVTTGNYSQSGSSNMTLDLPTLNADTATGHTLAKALRETAEAARKGAAEATARAESLRAQAAAMNDKPDLADAAAGLLAEAAMWEERAQNRLGTAAAYEDAAQAAETEEGK